MPVKVLIVDAETSSWQSAVGLLGDKGYEVAFSDTYGNAMERTRTQGFMVVIADLGWPRLEGLSFISQLSKLQPKPLVLAVSHFSDSDIEHDIQVAGASGFLLKPINGDDLLKAISSSKADDDSKGEATTLSGKSLNLTLLRGFTDEQQWDFHKFGVLREYLSGDVIEISEEQDSMIMVESGRVLVCYNNVPVESLSEGDFWGEEVFINPGSIITYLVAQGNVLLRHFSRKRMIEYFAYNDETLTKRFMINLINCLHVKWNKNVVRLVQTVQHAGNMGLGADDAT